jgi:spermidine/putrescine transport system ATP-binding protein
VPEVEVRLTQVYKAFGSDAAGRRVAQYVDPSSGGIIVAVDHIDLEVRDGEFFSLLGPSGCGKTTTLRMIGGFEQPTSGKIELDGQDVTWLPAYQRNVNTVFQNYALFPHLSIFENVAFGLRRRHVPEAELKRRVTEMLELVELPGYERRKPAQISGGQAQRVALARALVNKPAVLLLDEPLGALDLKLRKQMQLELKRIQQEVGITFIYVTHDQEEAMTMSDRIAVMNRGKYEQLADPETLYERPATEFVAGFLGVSNLLPATLGGRDGGYVLANLTGGAIVRVPASATEGKSSIRIGVRPEKIRLHAEAAAIPDRMNRLLGRVLDASYLGASTSYLIESGAGERLTVFEQNVERTSHGSLHRPGEEVHLSWSPDHTFAVGKDSIAPAQASTTS